MKFNNNSKDIRLKIREGSFSSTTSGLNPGFTQTNVAILPNEYALDFMIFCQRNPRSCPLIEVLTPGKVEAQISSPGSDIRTDVPKYRVFKSGKMISEITDIHFQNMQLCKVFCRNMKIYFLVVTPNFGGDSEFFW